MKFGYLIFVSSIENVDYLKMAYCLAMSIKLTQKEGYDKIALVIDDKSKIHNLTSNWVFDEIIEWNKETYWNGRSWMDKLSPWDYTVCLDADMLFFRDYSHWIEYFIKNSELYIANKAYTFRNEQVTSDFYRKTFTANDLPNLYSFYTFFKKDSDISKEFFDLGRSIIKNPIEFSNFFLSKHKPKVIGTDEAFALSSKILGITDIISYPLEFPRIVHFKPAIQNTNTDNVSLMIGFYFNQAANLKLGNYQQYDIVHYVDKWRMSDEFVSILENKLWKK